MKAFWHLFAANIKMTFRNKQALFWRLVFPIIFIVIFGLFNLDSFSTSKILVIDEAQNEISRQITDGLSHVDFFKIEEGQPSDLDAAKNKLKHDEINFIVVIPESAKNVAQIMTPQITVDPKTQKPIINQPVAPDEPAVKIEVFYNEANVTANQVVLNLLDQLTTEINAGVANTPKLFAMEKESLTDRKIRYIDFLIPGIVAMSLMNSSILSTAVYLTDQREKKILKRILVTPIDRKLFIAAMVLGQLVIASIQTVIILLAGKVFYDVQIFGSYLDLAILAILGTLVFINLGFVIAAVSRTSQAAESLSQVITMPMMFLSGVFFSVESLPTIIRHIVQYLPLSPLIESLRQVILNGDGLSSSSHNILLIGGWVVATFIAAVSIFKLARE